MDIPTAEQLAAYSLTQQHPMTIAWSTPEARLRLLAREHELDVRMATDLDFAEMRRDRFGPDLATDFFLNTWVELADDLSVMLSARWKGGEPTRPFVDASALSRQLDTEEDLQLLRQSARQRFGPVRPRYVRWWSREPAGHFPGTRQDKRFLAAPIRELLDADVPAGLTLSPAEGVESRDDLDELRQGTRPGPLLDDTPCRGAGSSRGIRRRCDHRHHPPR